jgi:hypothetical protein
MRQFCLVLAVAIATFAPIGLAQPAGPYKVLKTARVGKPRGEGVGCSAGAISDYSEKNAQPRFHGTGPRVYARR